MRRRIFSLASQALKASDPRLPSTRGLAEAAAVELKKTPLHDYHLQNGGQLHYSSLDPRGRALGKMVDFCGWSMPVQYTQSVMESTKHCRSKALLFDVSHMCGLSLKGRDAVPFLEKLVVGDIKAIKPGTGSLSVFTTEKGGIIDDSVITKVAEDDLYLVVNAGRRDVDLAHLNAQLKANASMDVRMEVHDDRGLLALQGPSAAGLLQSLVTVDLSKLYFSNYIRTDVDGVPCWITRTGYTGEDGFECSIPADALEKIAKAFMKSSDVQLGGLGARDALRLEAGLCLYGNDITEETSPIEAGLTWCISKSRRAECSFLGGERIKKELADGVSRKRVGLFTDGPPARAHSDILDPSNGDKIGEITSGAYSPNLGRNIGMGYVNLPHNKKETAVKVAVRNKQYGGVITGMPFVPTKYYKPS